MRDSHWYQMSESATLDAFQSNAASGMTHEEAKKRLVDFGANQLEGSQGRGPWKILLAQFFDFMVLVLVVAAVVAGIMGEPQDSFVILAIIVLNASLGFVQEYRAERALERLKSLAAPLAKVRRHGVVHCESAFELVPGDIVLLEAGAMVPADLRLIEVHDLRVDESTLTGESVPVQKENAALGTELRAIADQKNMAFKGTLITSGRGSGLVVRTGMRTELGRIAQLLKDEVEVRTPLQMRLGQLASRLAWIVLAICAVVFVLGLLRGEESGLMFMTAVSLAVAAVPEALPAVITVALALGARTMSRHNALVRKLPAVESLGSVTCICTDKTGTLTENRMSVLESWLAEEGDPAPGQCLDLEGSRWPLRELNLALNNDVTRTTEGFLQGEPTELALAEEALRLGFSKEELELKFPRLAELPFTSERGMMSTVHRLSNGNVLVLLKGAPEKVLPLCRSTSSDLTEGQCAEQAVARMAADGLRVLALGYRIIDAGRFSSLSMSELENEIRLSAIVGLMDPPRKGVKEAVRSCQEAGIRVVMITGDHPETAAAIARQLGILNHEPVQGPTLASLARSGQVPGPGMESESSGKFIKAGLMSGTELAKLTQETLSSRIETISVFARVAPEQKIQIVKALQARGQIVAMTGDGVNDAPALKCAHVGVSMGKAGTDVAREASHLILLDDRFETIVAAVREGRRIYDNIRKFVRFALTGNSGEIWTLFLAPFLGLPIPLLPIHILWINLVTDGLPGLALTAEPGESSLMHRPPRPSKESILGRGLWVHVLWVGLLIAGSTLGIAAWGIANGKSNWQSLAFTVLTLSQMGHILAIRSEVDSLWKLGLRSNLPLVGTIFFTTLLQIAAVTWNPLMSLLKTQPLTAPEMALCLMVSAVVFFSVEIEKRMLAR